MVNSVDPDQTPRSAASDRGLHCFPKLSVKILRINAIVNDSASENDADLDLTAHICPKGVLSMSS